MDKTGSLVSSYDFTTQAGITALLAGIRQSELSSAEKNELRDLVFLYKNGGQDESVRISLEQKLSAHNITPVAAIKKPTEPEVAPAPEPDLPFGSMRPAPTFRKPTVSASEAKALDTQPVPPPASAQTQTGEVSPAVSQKPLEEVKQADQVTVSPVTMAAPADIPKVTPPITPSVSDTATTTPVPPASASPASTNPPTQTTSPVQPAPSTPAAAPTPSPEQSSYLNRIREIKAVVNQKVGNPVNLVDIDNEVGREYMNALLDAMKKMNGGVGGIDVAMQRLETAFVAVQKAIEMKEQAKQKPSVVSEVAQTTPQPASTPTPVSTPPEPVTSQSVAPVTPKPVVVTPPPTPPPAAVEPVIPPRPVVEVTPMPMVEPEPISPTPENVPASQINTVPSAPNPVTPVAVTPPTPPRQPSAESTLPVQSNVPSLADRKRNLTPNDLADSSKTEAGVTNPLYTAEIDSGLEQLLSDWSLFKKSGLFGTGPSGREHPLFKKIAGLQIPLLLAGRFEGATQEIRQSITDYMNGWRYEQGIIYEQGETFELYLRRVIKHILDLQKKRNPA
ncbi:MAG: hypothetical protein H6779_00845 [Candidatus Nomurabacteria bacterium]|nr:hypothetical protein [Candidatus Nomurabacteria bacterium]USN87977.1 MAG: hypothetical protein H6779_00845 [Candidatus Nomurabacteria bacterium]